MKKLLVLVLVIGLLLPVLAVSAQDTQPVIITWWATERGRDTANTRDLHFKLSLIHI